MDLAIWLLVLLLHLSSLGVAAEAHKLPFATTLEKLALETAFFAAPLLKEIRPLPIIFPLTMKFFFLLVPEHSKVT